MVVSHVGGCTRVWPQMGPHLLNDVTKGTTSSVHEFGIEQNMAPMNAARATAAASGHLASKRSMSLPSIEMEI